MQLAMCLFCAIANYIWIQQEGKKRYYLALDVYVEGNWENAGAQICLTLLTFWILLSYLVPISLFVTLEIVKFIQVRSCCVRCQHTTELQAYMRVIWAMHDHARPLRRALALSTSTATCATPRRGSGLAAETRTSTRIWARWAGYPATCLFC